MPVASLVSVLESRPRGVYRCTLPNNPDEVAYVLSQGYGQLAGIWIMARAHETAETLTQMHAILEEFFPATLRLVS